jgi:hypothetical protein
VLLGGIDVLVTGGLIGGGAEALHKLMMVVTSGLDATRRRIATSGPTRGYLTAAAARLPARARFSSSSRASTSSSDRSAGQP